jgi:hypothetical protein
LASSRLQTGVLPFLTTYLGPRTGCAGFEGVICPNDQKIVQHPNRIGLLLNGRFGPRKVLNPGSHMPLPQTVHTFIEPIMFSLQLGTLGNPHIS